jgi:hypothetical protein
MPYATFCVSSFRSRVFTVSLCGLLVAVAGCRNAAQSGVNNQSQTSRKEVFNRLAVDRTYEISDLGGLAGMGCTFALPGEPPPPEDPFLALERLITETVDPDSWSSNGGQATIVRQGTRDVIRQLPENHHQIQKLLEQLREERRFSRSTRGATTLLMDDGQAPVEK